MNGAEEGYVVDYLRVPVTDEKAPKPNDFGVLIQRCSSPFPCSRPSPRRHAVRHVAMPKVATAASPHTPNSPQPPPAILGSTEGSSGLLMLVGVCRHAVTGTMVAQGVESSGGRGARVQLPDGAGPHHHRHDHCVPAAPAPPLRTSRRGSGRGYFGPAAQLRSLVRRRDAQDVASDNMASHGEAGQQRGNLQFCTLATKQLELWICTMASDRRLLNIVVPPRHPRQPWRRKLRLLLRGDGPEAVPCRAPRQG